MKLTPNVHLVGSGAMGVGMTDPVDCNTYLVHDGHHHLLVDTGGGRTPQIRDNLLQLLGPDASLTVLITHAHADHAGGAAVISAGFRHAAFAASTPVADILEAGNGQAAGLSDAIRERLYGTHYAYPRVTINQRLGGGDTFQAGALTVEVVATEGHAAGHTSYLINTPTGRCLFTGDHLTADSRIALQPTDDCDVPKYVASLRRTSTLTAVDHLFPGHGRFLLNDAAQALTNPLDRLDQGYLPHNAY